MAESALDRPPRVLIVEDSPTMRQLLAEAVERVPGAIIDDASDGLSALIAIQRNAGEGNAYDLVFLDINLPVMDGLKLLAKIRSEEAFASTRVCVVTTETDPELERQCRALGAEHFMVKPIQRHDLDEVLQQALAGR